MKFNRIWYLAPLSWTKIARQLDCRITNPQEPADAGADSLEHAPHLALASFFQHYAVPAIGALPRPRVGGLDALKRGAAVVKLDAAPQSRERRVVEGALYAHCVLALDAKPGMHQLVGKLAIVGQ